MAVVCLWKAQFIAFESIAVVRPCSELCLTPLPDLQALKSDQAVKQMEQEAAQLRGRALHLESTIKVSNVG